jgi:hypothetical protein
MPCDHALAEELCAFIDAARIADNRKGYLFRTAPGRNPSVLLEKPMAQADAWHMIRRGRLRSASWRRLAITVSGQPASSRKLATVGPPVSERGAWEW